jgi:DNA primase
MDLKAVLAQIDLREMIAGELGAPVKHVGKVSHWTCPLHADGRTPSLAVWADGWKCFGCGEHGNAFDWLIKRQNIEFKEALKMLTQQHPLLATYATAPSVATPPKTEIKHPPSQAWQDQGMWTMMHHFTDLWGAQGAEPPVGSKFVRDYLLKRGLQIDTLRANSIGYNPRTRYEAPTDWNGAADERQVSIPEGILIPIIHGGVLWAIKIRQRAGVEPKYIHVRGSVPALYGADSLAGKDTAVICEGEFDSLLLRQIAGDLVGVATFGSATNNNDTLLNTWLHVLTPVKRLLIATDNDKAGDAAWEWWSTRTRRARRAAIPGGVKDITDAWQAGYDLRAWAQGLLA